MDYSIKYSPTAVEDLDRIEKEVFQACSNKEQTKKYLEELYFKIYEKRQFPESGTPLLLGKTFTGYRYTLYKSYIVFYLIDDKDRVLFVDRILFAKSNYLLILGL